MIVRTLIGLALVFGLGVPDARGQVITTLFASNNGLTASGSTAYFDVNVLAAGGLTVNSMAVNTAGTGNAFNIAVYTRTGTYSGNELSAAGWTMVSSGSGTGQPEDTPSFVDVSDFLLGPGVTGMAIHFLDTSNEYTNGNGSNQFYSNADLSLTLGSATGGLFSGSVFSPRIWNGTINYTVAAVPEPGPMVLALALTGALGLARLRPGRARRAG
ncbi:MAG: hypothetical protein AB7I30_15095 [Isosphaeraceae bacterium]